MNDFIQALEEVTKSVQKFFERILSGVLEILESDKKARSQGADSYMKSGTTN